MNWTCLVYGGPMVGVLTWWAVSARFWFKGPKVNIEHMMLGPENVLEGKDATPVDRAESPSAKAVKAASSSVNES